MKLRKTCYKTVSVSHRNLRKGYPVFYKAGRTDLGNITEGENEEALDNNKELSRIINGNPALLDLVMEIVTENGY